MCILGSVLLFLTEIVEIDVAEVGTKKRNLLFAAELFTLQLCFLHLLHLFTLFWHTAGDNVRLSDVVKFFFNILVCNALFFPSRAQILRNREN